MAGYILKIVMENTHPPVWRRVMVPDHITFADLHEIIQLMFGWSDEHIHEFCIPMDRIIIDNDEEGGMRGEHYQEEKTLIDPFIRSYKWIRYTYDFGDDWRHKIQIEKTDEAYEGRSAVLMKVKGDNFKEDSGGIWNPETSECCIFDKESVGKKLAAMEIPVNTELEEVVLLKESMDQLQNLYKIMQKNLKQFSQEFSGRIDGTSKKKPSPMREKIRVWETFTENQEKNLYLVKGRKNNQELLSSLGEVEVRDYCKYLQIPLKDGCSDEEKIVAISQTLLEHPEYLLYVFDEQEFAEFRKWIKYPEDVINGSPQNKGMIIKALALGLGEFQQEENKWNLSFASDIQEFVSKIDEKKKRETYLQLKRFDEKLGKLLCTYCVLELESLYEMYGRLYDKNIDKKDFFRILYWHSRYNDFVDTVYRLDGTCYVSNKEIDVERVLEKEAVYAKDLAYASYSRKEIDRLADDLSNRSDWVDILFTTLHYQMRLDIYDSQELLIDIITDIFSGSTLNELMEKLKTEVEVKWDLELYCELWHILTGLMLELELPMLRGRNRQKYGAEKGISPWTLDMAEDSDIWENTKECHMYEFPIEVQEWMEDATEYGSDEAIEQLVQYKEKNHICSEEFLFLLVQGCVTFCKTAQAEQLIRELKKSSSAGKKAGKNLEEHLREALEYDNEELEMRDNEWEDEGEFFGNREDTFTVKPYVRETPKIGRNDPCPCGSGKKYKKCCGK